MISRQTVSRFFFVLIGYILLASLGSIFATINWNSSPIWFASGFGVFCVTVFGYRYAAVIFLASIIKGLMLGQQFWLTAFIAFGPSLEAISGRWIFISIIKKRALLVFHNRLVSIVVTSVVSSAVSATIGLSAIAVFQGLSEAQYIMGWLTWYGGDLIGNLLIFPLLLNLRLRFKAKDWLTSREYIAVVVSVLGFIALNLCTKYPSILMLFFPVLVYLVIWFGATVALLSASLSVLACTIILLVGTGPFVLGPNSVNLYSSIIYLVTLSVVVLGIVSFMRAQALKQNVKLLFACWLIAFGGGLLLEKISEKNDNAHFRRHVENGKMNIKYHFEDYQTVLQGAAAFYRSSSHVTNADWLAFAHDFNVSKLLPGAKGLSFVQPVLKTEEAKLFKQFARDGVKDFKIRTFPYPGAKQVNVPDRFIIKYYAPVSGLSEGVAGADIGIESSLRAAAEHARDTGQPALITHLSLVSDVQKRPGFVLLVPIYKEVIEKDDVQERRRLHLGWTGIPFVAEEFLRGALKDELVGLDIKFVENETSEVLFQSGVGEMKIPQPVKKTIQLAQKTFTMTAYPKANADYTFGRSGSLLSSIIVFLSIFMAMIMVNLQLMNRRISHQVKAKTRELVKAQQLAESHLAMSVEASRLASLGEMAGGIAHEINNPLSIILAKIFNLKNKLRKGKMNSEDILPYIEKVEQTSYRIAKIVKGMKALTHDGSQYDFEITPLSQIVEDVMDVCREKFKSKGIEIRLNVSSSIKIPCRFIQISQVLINLLNNSEHAIEFMQNPWVEIQSFETSSYVGLKVIDSGHGISMEVANRMKDPFFTTKQVGKGTGLGLSIAQSIMKDHNGSLEYLKGSQNTTFVIKFPKGIA